ncbi:MAG: transposase [Chloroflexi bacterium]|nr:transposase [Chloroflexota bacterium]
MYGDQKRASYNGHFECVCHHPLYCFNQFGHCGGTGLARCSRARQALFRACRRSELRGGARE